MGVSVVFLVELELLLRDRVQLLRRPLHILHVPLGLEMVALLHCR